MCIPESYAGHKLENMPTLLLHYNIHDILQAHTDKGPHGYNQTQIKQHKINHGLEDRYIQWNGRCVIISTEQHKQAVAVQPKLLVKFQDNAAKMA